MKKTILTIAGSALIVLSAVQFAATAERHHGRTHQRVYSSEFRDSNAYAAPPYDAYRYSGGYSAPAGR